MTFEKKKRQIAILYKFWVLKFNLLVFYLLFLSFFFFFVLFVFVLHLFFFMNVDCAHNTNLWAVSDTLFVESNDKIDIIVRWYDRWLSNYVKYLTWFVLVVLEQFVCFFQCVCLDRDGMNFCWSVLFVFLVALFLMFCVVIWFVGYNYYSLQSRIYVVTDE